MDQVRFKDGPGLELKITCSIFGLIGSIQSTYLTLRSQRNTPIMNVNVTREQAICMLFCVEYNDANVAELVKRITDMEDIDVCYEVDPCQPFLLPLVRMNGNPFRYRRYLTRTSPSTQTEQNEDENMKLTSHTDVRQFLNEVYLPQNPHNEEVYDKRDVSIQEILATVWKYSTVLDDRTPVGFSKWCNERSVKFLKANVSRKVDKDDQGRKRRRRTLYVMKEAFIDNIVLCICKLLPNYQQFINGLKADGYHIVGYARKSPGNEDSETRARLLQEMVERLRSRSLVDRVFISASSSSSDPLHTRDVKVNHEVWSQLKEVNGNTQDMITYLHDTKNVCIVAIDSAGFSTNAQHVRNFTSDNTNLSKIIIEGFAFGQGARILERKELLESEEIIASFDNRRPGVQRSRR
ncbi:unnamed protein product [Umbelopsis vinacea]